MDKHIVGGIVFYKHIFLVLFLSLAKVFTIMFMREWEIKLSGISLDVWGAFPTNPDHLRENCLHLGIDPVCLINCRSVSDIV